MQLIGNIKFGRTTCGYSVRKFLYAKKCPSTNRVSDIFNSLVRLKLASFADVSSWENFFPWLKRVYTVLYSFSSSRNHSTGPRVLSRRSANTRCYKNCFSCVTHNIFFKSPQDFLKLNNLKLMVGTIVKHEPLVHVLSFRGS